MNRNFTQKPLISKSQLRNKFILLRNGLTRAEVSKKSGLIGQKLLTTAQISTAKSVSAYLPIGNEAETKPLIDALVARGANVYLPAYDVLSKSYVFPRFNGWDDLEPGPYGILQPSDSQANTPGVKSRRYSESTPEVSLDVAIIPGLAFDKRGVRLGYGKGVFDRLLAHSKAFKIGLAYDFQVVDKLPKETHDLVMDIVVTEKRFLDCNKVAP